ncbi:MAG: site-2 protease family protein [Rhizobiales bacterium]|nr:site-2 protease family protein [Hyphomicrobiales bacterium]
MNVALALAGLVLFRGIAFLTSGPDAILLGEGTLFPSAFSRQGPTWPIPVLAGLRTFTELNALLGLLNLLPGFPLDGGMIVRALLDHVAKPEAAVRLTAALGLVAGLWVCAAAGVIGFGALVLGLLLVAINGWALKTPQDFT